MTIPLINQRTRGDTENLWGPSDLHGQLVSTLKFCSNFIEPYHEKTCLLGFHVRSDSNRAVRPLKMDCGLIFRFIVRYIYMLSISVAKNKALQMIYKSLFFAYANSDFLMMWLRFAILME